MAGWLTEYHALYAADLHFQFPKNSSPEGLSMFPAMKWKMRLTAMLFAALSIVESQYAWATDTQVTGTVLQVEGHLNPACRRLVLQPRGGSATLTFRLPNTGADNSILSVALTALASGHSINVDYDPTVTTGCGTEPQITFVTLLANG
jgi:hypothetical protein